MILVNFLDYFFLHDGLNHLGAEVINGLHVGCFQCQLSRL